MCAQGPWSLDQRSVCCKICHDNNDDNGHDNSHLQAAHTPFCFVFTPCLFMSSWRWQSMSIKKKYGHQGLSGWWKETHLQVSKHVIKVGSSSNNRLVHIALVHLEVVQGGHQVVQLCSRRWGTGGVRDHGGVGLPEDQDDILMMAIHYFHFASACLLVVVRVVEVTWMSLLAMCWWWFAPPSLSSPSLLSQMPNPMYSHLPCSNPLSGPPPFSVPPLVRSTACSWWWSTLLPENLPGLILDLTGGGGGPPIMLLVVENVLIQRKLWMCWWLWHYGDAGDGGGGDGDGEPAFCHRLFCLHMTTVPGSWEVLQWDSFEMWYLPFLKIYIIIMILPGFMLEQWDSKRRTIVMPEQLMYKKAPDCKRWRIFI